MLIGLYGVSRAGKDSVAKHLESKHGYTWKHFSYNLKEMLYRINPWLPDMNMWYQDAIDGHGMDEMKARSKVSVDYMIGLGQSARDIIDSDVWVKSTITNIMPKNTVISDMRQPNEAQRILECGGELWRIHRPTVDQNKRAMDGLLDDYDFAVEIWNTGTIKELENIVDTILEGR